MTARVKGCSHANTDHTDPLTGQNEVAICRASGRANEQSPRGGGEGGVRGGCEREDRAGGEAIGGASGRTGGKKDGTHPQNRSMAPSSTAVFFAVQAVTVAMQQMHRRSSPAVKAC